MPVKKFKPTTPGRRQMTGYTFEELTTSRPLKSLTVKIQKKSWRNSSGRITVRHQWGGAAQRYRLVDFFFHDKKGIEATVKTIEYDPYRTAYIALVNYKDGEKRYVLAHTTMKVGDKIITNTTALFVPGNRVEIGNIPTGLEIHNLEMIVWQGASAIRSAGSCGVIVTQEGEYTQVKMPSGEIRLVNKKCYATIGKVSNPDHNLIVIGKAGRSRHMGIRPTVLGKSMNPVDHPHGGWEGHSPIGLKNPKTPWWAPALGYKTRSRKKATGKWILRNRKGKLLVK